MTFMKLKINSAIHEEEDTKTDTITSSTASLKYTGLSDTGASKFTYTDANQASYDFEFNL
jgi:hypothetical protein